MPFKDPQTRKKYYRTRYMRLAEQCRAAAREYSRTHKEQKRQYDQKRYERLGESKRGAERDRWAKRDKKRTAHLMWVASLKRNYGLTLEQWESMLIAQTGRCDLCGSPLKGRIGTDHDHKTGRVRGLLHHRCNIGLPYVEDTQFLRAALAYLGKYV